MTVSFSTVLSETDRRGRKGSGPGFVSAGLAVGSSPSLNAALTASFQALSARFATSALSRHVESRASASCRKPRSTDFSGDRTASRPGDLLEKGAPIAIAQITDGSAQPDQLPAAPARSTYALRHPSQAPTRLGRVHCGLARTVGAQVGAMDSEPLRPIHLRNLGQEAIGRRMPARGMKTQRGGKRAGDTPNPQVGFGQSAVDRHGLAPAGQRPGFPLRRPFFPGSPDAVQICDPGPGVGAGAVNQP